MKMVEKWLSNHSHRKTSGQINR